MNLKYYKSIEDIPIFNWSKVHSLNDFSYMLEKNRKLTDKESIFLSLKWRDLYNQYIEEFGFNESFLNILEKQREIALLQIEKMETGEKTIATFIEIEKNKLKLMTSKIQTSNLYDSKTLIEREIGFNIDIKKCSVMEYYSYIKSIEKNGK